MSLRLRLAALFTLATLILLGIGSYLYVTQLQASARTTLDAQLSGQAATVQARLAGSHRPWLHPAAGMYAQAYAADGTLLGSSHGLRDQRLLTPAQLAEVAAGRTLRQDARVPLTDDDKTGKAALRVYATRTGSGPVIAVAASSALADRAVQRATDQLIVLGAAVLLLIGPGSWLLARGALRPVERMRAQVARIQADSASHQLAVPGTHDEIARLASTFNELLARLRAALTREQAFVADAGHELRTPLTVLKAEFELADRPGRTRGELLDAVRVGAEETDRLIRLTERLLSLSGDADTPEVVRFDLTDVARASLAGHRAVARERGVTLRLIPEAPVHVHGDPERLRQAIDNLVANAVRHSPDRGTVTVRLTHRDDAGVIEVFDEGPGFAAEFLPRAFERFTRADDARRRDDRHTPSQGLGLAIVAAVATAHGGRAEAANRAGGGASVSLRWPQPATPSPAELPPPALTPRGHR